MKASQPHDRQEALEFAWRVHGALDNWIGKVDTKASIALAIESAVFGFVVTLSQRNGPFAALTGSSRTWFHVGLAMLLIAVLLSLIVVLPQLNRRKSKKIWRSNMIYFGHLRHWEPKELATALGKQPLYQDQLAEQLVAMSKIAWRKHSWLQGSLIFLAVGVAILLFVAGP